MRRTPNQLSTFNLAQVLVVRRQPVQSTFELGREILEILVDLVIAPLAHAEGLGEGKGFVHEEGSEVLGGGDIEEVLQVLAGAWR